MQNSFLWIEIGIIFLGRNISEAVVDATFYDHGTRNYAFLEQLTHNTNQLNTFASFPDAETWSWRQDGEPLPLIRVGTLFCDHDGHGHL